MIRENSPVPLDRLLWVVKYGPSKVHSHIQVLDEKHIYYATRKGEGGIISNTTQQQQTWANYINISTEIQQMH